jgi:16S rRNA (cytidine1402-2'-O)-methyltransferase
VFVELLLNPFSQSHVASIAIRSKAPQANLPFARAGVGRHNPGMAISPSGSGEQQQIGPPVDWQEQSGREQDWPAGALYVIATPIGNLRDITLRALDCLTRLDGLGAEDTRLTRRLLDQYHIKCATFALHQHNEAAAAQQVISRLQQGERIGYVSDAGTPGISDPGARLVSAVAQAGFRVIPIAGVSALTGAVSAAGLPDAPLFFLGFLSSKQAQARRELETCLSLRANLVMYEAPHRIEATLKLLAGLADPGRRVTVARELTKQFETIVTGPLSGIEALLEKSGPLRGEFVVLLHAAPQKAEEAESNAHDSTLLLLMQHLPVSEAVAVTAQLSGAARKALYKRALELRPRDRADAESLD